MGAFHERDIKDYIENAYGDAKEIEIYCPKITVNVSVGNKTEQKTYHDITKVFDDFEEGKVMGRHWIFEK